MKRTMVLAVVLAFVLGMIAAWSVAVAKDEKKDASMDPLVVGPDKYKMVMENERVRLLEVTFKPGDKIAMHSHPDHAAYVLEPGQLTITNAEGKTSELTAKKGDTFWIPAESHSAVNPGTTPIKVLVIELKEPAQTAMKSDASHGH